MFYHIFSCVLIFALIFEVNCDDPQVDILQGRLRGGTRTNRDGGTYYSFQNIPFGKPPVGELRFRAPEPAEGWEGTRDATEDLPMCVQLFADMGQEDCLYLNVYTPEFAGENVTQKPVMVWIYGGAFVSGIAMESRQGAQFLLTKDVVVVTLNYRVGIFGFLSLDDPNLGVTGNAGLKDQVLALKWVNNNIQYFGGDPNNILIFGESAGAMSVHLQILSPMSKGLFQKAISESGCALTDMITAEFRNTGAAIAQAVGIQTENWSDMLQSLRNVPARTLSSAEMILQFTNGFFSGPLIEVASNEPSFLPEPPLDIIRSGNYNQVPYMIGFNDAEGLLFQIEASMMTGQSLLITDFAAWIPSELEIEPGSIQEATLSQRIKHFYYGDSEPSRDDISGAVYLTTDQTFGFPAYRSTLEHLRTSLFPIYFYYFTADTRLNFFKQRDAVASVFPGASHSDEIGYLWHGDELTFDIEEGSIEDVASRNMVNLWTNFAIYGDPTPAGYEYNWEPVQEHQFNYLHIDTEESTMKIDPTPASMQFWSEIYAEYFPFNK